MRTGGRLAAGLAGVDHLEGPDREGDQVAGQRLASRRSTTRLHVAGSARLGDLRRVGEGQVWPAGTSRVSCQGILKEGSSKQGKARRASVASNWVKMYQSPFSSWR